MRSRSGVLARMRTAGAAALALATLAGCGIGAPRAGGSRAAGSGYPVTVTSCGVSTTVKTRPERAVTLNQGATQVALALGLGDRLAGTAYLDGPIPAKWRTAYDKIPVLSAEYPSKERFLAAQPDFAYASYGSAFDDTAVGTQRELAGEGVPSYLSPFGCDDEAQRPKASWAAVWNEVDSVAKVFGVANRASALRRQQQESLDRLRATGAGKGLRVLWYDSGRKTPFIGAGHGGPQLIIDAVGATNAFANLPGNWADGNWEEIVAADPDVIVLADASWDTAKGKIAYLERDPVLSQLRAVRQHRFVVIPFFESTPGVALMDGAVSVSRQLRELVARR